ncbi:RNA-binding S4 domain-containing protein [Novosphingobium rosa]|uniref:RNA-binding S4 domain-containing protein n=1 Tax=Novosphingobium rosa TaxID=76978 RepID=UPI000835BEF4|nr:S4 domain-containing protein [Novosphingobium rosa]
MRIDKLLWFLRLSPTRPRAHDWVLEGHMRLNGRRVERPGASVKSGDILVLPLPHGVRVIEILVLPPRRGPAPEAQACYRVLDETRVSALAAPPSISADLAYLAKGDLQP